MRGRQRRRAARAAAGGRRAAGRDRHRARPQPEPAARRCCRRRRAPLVDRVAGRRDRYAGAGLAPLRRHGPRARTRRYVRALVPGRHRPRPGRPRGRRSTGRPAAAILAVLPLLLAARPGPDRARALGHALVEGWLVARSGSLTRRRELLATDAVIGWNVQRTWFQRRAGLVTLVATTAGGRQSVPSSTSPSPTPSPWPTPPFPTSSTSSRPGERRRQLSSRRAPRRGSRRCRRCRNRCRYRRRRRAGRRARCR